MLAGRLTEASVLPGGISHAMAEVGPGWRMLRRIASQTDRIGRLQQQVDFTQATFRGGTELSKGE
jgi:hypothetical protein